MSTEGLLVKLLERAEPIHMVFKRLAAQGAECASSRCRHPLKRPRIMTACTIFDCIVTLTEPNREELETPAKR